ncbi:hypothetical protein [Moraxella canis]|uniref:hypothetical protein n=1 Tax=Moraxella canis TaxID=90239 RepID=UPI000668FBDB|nr:hypothetical protein [Moraxella canis]
MTKTLADTQKSESPMIALATFNDITHQLIKRWAPKAFHSVCERHFNGWFVYDTYLIMGSVEHSDSFNEFLKFIHEQYPDIMGLDNASYKIIDQQFKASDMTDGGLTEMLDRILIEKMYQRLAEVVSAGMHSCVDYFLDDFAIYADDGVGDLVLSGGEVVALIGKTLTDPEVHACIAPILPTGVDNYYFASLMKSLIRHPDYFEMDAKQLEQAIKDNAVTWLKQAQEFYKTQSW